MNRWIPLLLALVLLTGCAAQNPQPQPTEVPIPTPAEIPAPFGFRDVGNALETQSFGALQVFPLPEEAAGFLPLGDGILLFSAREAGTELTLLTGESLVPTESISLSFVLTSRNSTLTYCSEGISFFDDQAMQTVILDHTLQELRRIKVPDNLTGMPILSHDGSILYYCTASAVRALDLHTGISRIIKETAYPMQSVSGLFLEDSILLLSITDQNNAFRTLFLSTPTGLQLAEYDGVLTLATCGANYYTKVYSGASEILMFGQADNAPQVLLPNNAENTFFLEPLHGAVTITPSVNAHTTLEYYDLSNGVRTAALTLEETLYPEEVHAAADGSIWFLAKNGNDESIALYRWQPERSAVQDTQLYTAAYYTRQNPDYDGLAACTLYAYFIAFWYRAVNHKLIFAGLLIIFGIYTVDGCLLLIGKLILCRKIDWLSVLGNKLVDFSKLLGCIHIISGFFKSFLCRCNFSFFQQLFCLLIIELLSTRLSVLIITSL